MSLDADGIRKLIDYLFGEELMFKGRGTEIGLSWRISNIWDVHQVRSSGPAWNGYNPGLYRLGVHSA